ncbi:EscV/YscV/HrcV family type III secretion system export apparatus protein [Pseudoxanthomonas sp. UTMC 1351]|uniref:EscV/YscV/HrcV family type III secretion system export apparatus protein n=1 Tax=Pseudoxanthomonas sp. UTMC 1351 TaxID=2695853 RepID=UPI0034CF61A6
MSSIKATTAHGRFPNLFQPELALVVIMAVVVAMLILPLPTALVDVFIGLNMAVAIVIFLSSFYVERILNFSTFPSIILFTTLMRLALSVSTSRLILLDGDAGHIVQAFGEFVVADNLVVGFVIFGIVTLVQFIVITKGSERIGEVVARFSLDGMPGKQMSIDADLRASAITAEQAQKRRSDVERESQLYGSYDGAMKFVKGDAIAGIVIVLVNLIGGIAVGVLQHGMPFEQALKTFTLLTVGDGLVAQIPALLICVSAGFVVTRVSGERQNLGANILSELFNSNIVLCLGAILVLALGLLPGFPFWVFLLLSSALFALFLWRSRAARSGDGSGEEAATMDRGSSDSVGSLDGAVRIGHESVPIIVLMPAPLVAAWNAGRYAERLKEAFQIGTGVQLPQMTVRAFGDTPHAVSVLINEVPAHAGHLVLDHCRVLGPAAELEALGLMRVATADGGAQWWVPSSNVVSVRTLGFEARDEFEELLSLITQAALVNISELFGIQETKHVLDELEGKFPELVKETYRHVPVQRVAEVLQRLLREGISIRNMKIVLEALAQWGQREKDVILLVEHVRGALARYISARFARDGRISVLAVSSATEELIRGGIRHGQGAAFLNLEPAKANELLGRFVMHVQEVGAFRHDVVVMVPPDIRRFVKRFIENRLPHTHVISFAEVSDTVAIDILRTL